MADTEKVEKTKRQIAEIVGNIRGEECEVCKGACQAYAWYMSSASGVCNFSLTCHEREIWFRTIGRIDIGDFLLLVLGGLLEKYRN